ncbi:MAG: hypothetical protein QE271_01475 [Bacteriovoracaceae bacterium]|nr:hypothetical protein [Bacteriovoracaceae bacterium]
MPTVKPSAAKFKEPSNEDKEKLFKRRALEVRYRQRFTIAKEGKRALQMGDHRNMVLRYTEYLRIITETYEAPSIYEIKPEMFNSKTDVAELLLISQIYWELAKLYDQSDRVIDKLKSCLSQFVRFTINQQFQSLNTEVVRKDLRKCRFKHEKIFKSSLEIIYKDSRKCYMVTYYAGESEILEDFRLFKDFLWIKVYGGKFLVQTYYQISPIIIERCERSTHFRVCMSWAMSALFLVRKTIKVINKVIHHVFSHTAR